MAGHTSRCVILLFFYCSLTPRAACCDEDGPEDCQFQRTYCSWTPSGNISRFHDPQNSKNLIVGFVVGKLTSRTACSTEGQEHCFGFDYFFELIGTVNLSVAIQYADFDEAEPPLWTTSVGSRRVFARVPVNTSREFSVVFHAERLVAESGASYFTYMDNIIYWQAPCSSDPPPFPEPTEPLSSEVIIGVVVAINVVLVILVLVICFVMRKKHLCAGIPGRGGRQRAERPELDNDRGQDEGRPQRMDNGNIQQTEQLELSFITRCASPATGSRNRQQAEEFEEGTDGYQVPMNLRAERERKEEPEGMEDGPNDHHVARARHTDKREHVDKFAEDKDGYLVPSKLGTNGDNRQKADHFEEGSYGYLVPVTRKKNALFVAL